MIHVIYGAAGMLAVLVILAAGALLGWKGRGKWQERTRQAVDRETDERERREAAEQQKAFEGLLNYSMDTAYGLHDPLAELREGGKG